MNTNRWTVSLRIKLLVILTFSIILVFGAFLRINKYRVNKFAEEQAWNLANAYAEKYALKCKNALDVDMGFSTALAKSMQNLSDYTINEQDSIYGNMMQEMIKSSPRYTAVWNSIELSILDSSYTKDYGRRTLVTYKRGSEYPITTLFRNLDGDEPGSFYHGIKTTKISGIAEPYIDADYGNVLITSITAPIFIDGKYAGIAGIDMLLDAFQKVIENADIIDGAKTMVLSHKGILVGATDTTMVGAKLSDILPEFNQKYQIISLLQKDSVNTYEYKRGEKEYLATVLPFKIHNTETTWGFGVALPKDYFLAEAKRQIRIIRWIGILGIIILSGVTWVLSSQIIRPIKETTQTLKELARGKIDDTLRINIKSRDEIEEMGNSMNRLISALQKTVQFTREIGAGNLEAQLELASREDQLGKDLVKMRDNLLESRKKEEERTHQDERMKWLTQGLADFAHILRQDHADYNMYIRDIISKLVKYAKLNQGAIFLVNDNDNENKFIELKGSYSLDRKKLNMGRIEFGEGLIGTSINEGRTRYIDNLPKNYTTISSGLGGMAPQHLLIVPLKDKEEAIGAIELASVEPIDDFKIDFIEQVSESIASSISSIHLQRRTKELLDQSNLQTEKMLAQEEALRQNMEEMLATQEEMNKKEAKIKKVIEEMQEQEQALKTQIKNMKNSG